MKMRLVFVVCLLLCAELFAGYQGTVLGSERTRNLRQLDYAPMLFVYHGQTVAPGRHFFTYPERNKDFRKYFHVTERGALAYLADSIGSGPNAHTYAFAVSPVVGLDYRGGDALGDTIWPAFDGGLFVRGYADSLDFDLDARIYAEGHSAGKPKSFDGEVFDVQNEDRGGLNYVSFARYRAHMGFNYSFARLQLARDVLHFGPGYYNNLTLNQFALPYNMLTLDLTFGPLRIFSAYADLRVNSWSYSKANLNDRNMYAHRYELALGALSLGVSEIQILYNENKPWLFVPIVPLFIEKGNYTERVNNGALALDANLQLLGLARLYGEFFLDDMESPYAVYENKYSNNRWAAMAGIQIAHDFYVGGYRVEAGSIAEIARVEPYTYCHYDTAQAQMAHLGAPLGNPNGPNSLAVDWTLYARLGFGSAPSFPGGGFGRNLFVGFHNKWLWKGVDYGSNIDDPYKTVEKRFIHGAPLAYTLAPSVGFQGRNVAYFAEFTFVDEKSAYVRVSFMW
ncbi:hypothetical protein [uncultured Fibrobacter sp.]|uniref:hypothetical protein n=1 Tax=uncultured Fibrobacter sp. TaxID=261512 RepID=UPI0025DA74D4|nr:hypothetical protein [uncultured Fibrobacter sp.]